MDRRLIVHDEFRRLRSVRDEDPAGHSDVVDHMFEKIESELSKLPLDQAIPYRASSSNHPLAAPSRRYQTTRISADGEARVVVEEDEGDEDGEEEEPTQQYRTKEEVGALIRARMSKAEEVQHYKQVIDQAMDIQHKALSRISKLVEEMNGIDY